MQATSSKSNHRYLFAMIGGGTTSVPDAWSTVVLKDPATGEDRTYLTDPDNKTATTIHEVQSMTDDYASFLVQGSYVVGDGNLYVVTPVDPLFWLLSKKALSSDESPPWQPLDQVLEDQPAAIVQAIPTEQLGHVLDRMELSEDEYFYKFSTAKALQWLRKKQQRTEQVLVGQLTKLRRDQTARREQLGGAFSENFAVPSAKASATPAASESTDTALSDTDLKRAKMESFQIVCSYLCDEWKDKFLADQQLPADFLKPAVKKRSVGVTQNQYDPTMGYEKIVAIEKKAKIEAPKTSGAKRLAKANTKGMSKLSSFFGAKKKE